MHFNENFVEKIRFFSSFQLKMIAMITMLIDHVGAVLFPQYMVFRIIGRIAFPIYCFLLVEGGIHTKNPLKYSARLLLFALISEIPFDLAFGKSIMDFNHQNVFFTLFLGLVGIIMLKQRGPIRLLGFLMPFVAEFLKTDYGAYGVLIILLFYVLHEHVALKMSFFGLLTYLNYNGSVQLYACLSIIPMLFYNGKRGYNIKYAFYVFYPLHLLVLYFIAHYLKG